MNDREARRARRDAEWARRDAEDEQRARLDARIDDAAAVAPSVLPGDVGETLAAVLAAMKPFRAADGYLAFSAVGRSSDEVVALAEAILAVPAEPPSDTGQAPDVTALLRRLAEIEDEIGRYDWSAAGTLAPQATIRVREVRALLGTNPEAGQ